MKKTLISLTALAVFTAPVLAQNNDEPTLYDRALAAGYKAQFICSGLFNGGKSLADIEADELTGIYDRVADIVPTLKVQIDREKRRIIVQYDDNSPPRIAEWEYVNGCTGLPLHSEISAHDDTPFLTVEERLAPMALDNRQWPMGDKNALSETLSQEQFRALGTVAASAFRPGDFAAGAKAYGGKTSAIIVLQGENIVWEGYKPGHDMHVGQRTWSVAKSIAGTYAGFVMQKTAAEGIASPEDIGPKFWGGNIDPRSTIKLDNFLRMASGLYSDTAGNRTDPIYLGGSNISQRTISWPLLHKPGEVFRYSNNDIMLASKIITDHAWHYDTPQSGLLPHDLFDAIGMTRTYAETDWQGDYILSSQVWTTARDLVRLGMLYLNNGKWPYGEGEPKQLLPPDWREYVSTPSGPQPDGAFGYGATFWLMNNSEGVPKDSFAGFGNRGQYLVIIPSRDLVIVRRGYDTAADRFDIAAFTRDIVAALPR